MRLQLLQLLPLLFLAPHALPRPICNLWHMRSTVIRIFRLTISIIINISIIISISSIAISHRRLLHIHPKQSARNVLQRSIISLQHTYLPLLLCRPPHPLHTQPTHDQRHHPAQLFPAQLLPSLLHLAPALQASALTPPTPASAPSIPPYPEPTCLILHSLTHLPLGATSRRQPLLPAPHPPSLLYSVARRPHMLC